MKNIIISLAVYFCLACRAFSVPFAAGMAELLPPSEYSALVDLYNSTNGGGWKIKNGWLVDTATYWNGVTVTGQQYNAAGVLTTKAHVTRISLAINQLSGPLPSSPFASG